MQIVDDDGMEQHQRLGEVIGKVPRRLSMQTPVHHHTKLVFNPFRNVQPMELIM